MTSPSVRLPRLRRRFGVVLVSLRSCPFLALVSADCGSRMVPPGVYAGTDDLAVQLSGDESAAFELRLIADSPTPLVARSSELNIYIGDDRPRWTAPVVVTLMCLSGETEVFDEVDLGVPDHRPVHVFGLLESSPATVTCRLEFTPKGVLDWPFEKTWGASAVVEPGFEHEDELSLELEVLEL